MPGRKARKGATPVKSRPRATTRRRSKPQPRQRPSRLAIEKALAEALEQQAATGEILRVISSSPDNAQPVFDTIAKSAARLCKAEFCHVFRFDGEHLHFAAHHGLSPKDFEVARRAYPMRPGRGTAAARSILSGAIEQIPDVLKDREFVLAAFSKRVGQRSVVAVPMLKQGRPIGSIAVVRSKPGLLPERQIALLQTFADQAVIAVENVRLFNETQEALEQQIATGEILQAISRSPGNLQPVFDTLVRAAARFCGAPDVAIMRLDSDVLRAVAATGQFAEVLKREAGSIEAVELPFNRESVSGRAVSDRRIVHIHDLAVESEEEYPIGREMQRRFGHHSTAATPLLREGRPLGVIVLFRTEVRPFSEKQLQLLRIFADQAVIAIENVRLFRELESRNRDLVEALEQQTATSDILRVISRSPTDVQPVFETIVKAALSLCRAHSATVLTYDGEMLHVGARLLDNATAEEFDAIRGMFPRPPGRDTAAGRAILTRRIVVIPDVLEDADYEDKGAAIRGGFRSAVAVPLMRDGSPIGTINIGLRHAGAFPDKQVVLLQTFADQAVIAIENVRLFHETREALEQQTATAEILQVISSSPTDVQPVFDTIAVNALKLCGASFSTCCRFDGESIHLAAFHHLKPEGVAAFHAAYPSPPSRGGITQRAILVGEVVHVADVLEDPEYVYHDAARVAGYRSVLAVPMLRDGQPIGAVTVFRDAAEPFPEAKIDLLKVFAEQAVIAIANVRLFNELEARNRDLTEALEQQTATSEILSVISQSPTDVKPVFEAIADAALRLCRGSLANVFRFDGNLVHLEVVKNVNDDPAYFDAIQSVFPRPPGLETAGGRAVVARDVIEIPDILQDPDYAIRTQTLMGGFRSVLAVPLMLGDKALGSITVCRPEPERFPRSQVALLQTFADQAVIAIENVRLFKELEVRNHDLTEALEQQTATGEVLKVISRSTFDLQPVLQTVIDNAVRVCGAEHGHIHRFDGEFLRLAAGHSANAEMLEYLRNHPNRLGPGTLSGMAGLERRPIHCHDVLTIPGYTRGEAQRLSGFRTILAVPILSADALLGVIMIWKTRVEPFTEKQIELVTAFADQAAIAIENVRLFNELEARNHDLTEALEQQTATSEILRAISRSPTDVQPVFDAIVQSAVKLCGADHSIAARFDGELLHPLAHQGFSLEALEVLGRMFPMGPSRESLLQRVALTRTVVNIPDMLADSDYSRDYALAGGWQSGIAVPMLRDGNLVGAIGVASKEAGRFSERHIALLQTFADQAVIAIENVRLFKELEARNRDLTEALEQQTATSEILRVISRSPTDVQPVFDTIAAAAWKLCGASSANVFTYDGTLVHLAALVNLTPEGADAIRSLWPRPLNRDLAATRAILSRSVVAIPDVLEDREFARGTVAVAGNFRSILSVPLMREGTPLGAIAVGRPEPGLFPETQIALLQTFADQAVIAIENVRLFKELEIRNRDLTEALEQQTATSEILSVISKSQTDVQPVFDTIAKAARELCRATSANVFTYDGELVHAVAVSSPNPQYVETIHQIYPRRPGRDTGVARAIQSCSVVMIPDVLADEDYVIELGAHATAGGFRSVLAVPLMREGRAIGGIAVGRAEPGLFPDAQVALLKTFADQAVIAIENMRLFKALEARNRDLTEALEHQTATSEILRVISSSPTDVQPVFDTICERAMKLCGAEIGLVSRLEGDQIHLASIHGVSREGMDAIGRLYPHRLDAELTGARCMRSRRVVHMADVLADPTYAAPDAAIIGRYRGVLAVPMVREGQVIGSIFVARADPGLFADAKVELLKTFADQAVIAIENVRLFNELKARTAQLMRSVGELKALGEVGQAVASTLDLGTVLRTIVSHATHLAGMDGGSIWEYDETREEFHVHETDRLPEELVNVLRSTPIKKGEGALGRLAVTGEPVEIRDFVDDSTYKSRLRNVLIRTGFRSVLAAPLLRDDHLLGALAVNRKVPGSFDPQTVELLKTFATQSALAIQNARLFREIEVKSRELETASKHKSEFLANMSHELRTPLNAIIGFSEVLAEKMFGEVNEKQSEYLADILESGRHLLSLINDILDLSKIEAGRMELEPSDFDLPAAIENALILVRERAQRRAIKLARDVDERLGRIRGDERKVKQVLLNLLSNALKFTPEGGRIDVRAAARDGVAEISVSDTGVGIALEDQAAVFEEFKQVGTASKKVEGTGLGLAISRKFIELHGGKMWVESQPGKGATFSFTLPQH